VESAPRAYRLKASNAAPPISTFAGAIPRVSLVAVIVVTVLMFAGIFSRMIPSQALISAIPEITKRGSFNAVSASVQQLSGGIASVIAGMVVAQGPGGELQHFDQLGYIVVATTLLSLGLMYFVQRAVAKTSRG
jgi:hypothetical protein